MHAILERIGELGIVPVVKIEKSDRAPALAKGLRAGGLPLAEITFRTAAAADAIRALRDADPDFLVGAGTVLTVDQAAAAVEAGAAFIVSPAFDPKVVDWCLSRAVPILPGVSGPDGVARGIERGLEVLKFFPAEVSGGCAMLDALAGPFGAMRFVPTGGIDASNVGDYARRRSVLAIGGSWMVKPELVDSGDSAGIEAAARESVLALHGFALAHVGLNNADEEGGRKTAGLLASLFGFALQEGTSSIFTADRGLEVTKRTFPGSHGHLGIRCNDVERAVAHFRSRGVGTKADSAVMDKGRIKAIYLEMEVGGFALHLLRA